MAKFMKGESFSLKVGDPIPDISCIYCGNIVQNFVSSRVGERIFIKAHLHEKCKKDFCMSLPTDLGRAEKFVSQCVQLTSG